MVCNAFRPVTNVCIGEDYHGYLVANAERSRFRRRNCDVIRRTCGTMECCRVVVCPTQVIDIPRRMYVVPFPVWGFANEIHVDSEDNLRDCFPLVWDYETGVATCTGAGDPVWGVGGDFRSENCDLNVQANNGSTTVYWTGEGAGPPVFTYNFYDTHIIDPPHVLIEFGNAWLMSAPGLMPYQMGGAIVGGVGSRVNPFPDTMSVTVVCDPLMYQPDVNGTFTLTWNRGAYYYFGPNIAIGVKLWVTGTAQIVVVGLSTNPSFPPPAMHQTGASTNRAGESDEPFTATWTTDYGFSATMTEV